jgi:hypothetical protein
MRILGNAELHHDVDDAWSTRIWAKYRSGQPNADALNRRLHDRARTQILVKQHQLIAVASI